MLTLRSWWCLLFSEYYSEIRSCAYCGRHGRRSEMVDMKAYGWVCDEDEADKLWFDMHT
jgi:hypothetical protein